jgi:hypothetical protein
MTSVIRRVAHRFTMRGLAVPVRKRTTRRPAELVTSTTNVDVAAVPISAMVVYPTTVTTPASLRTLAMMDQLRYSATPDMAATISMMQV